MQTVLSKRDRRAGYAVVRKPTKEEVHLVEEGVCHAMMLVGVEILSAWDEGQEKNSADLVTRIYAVMEAQRLIREATGL